MAGAKNVLGTDLELCCSDPLTGFYRDGYCNTGASDAGLHWVCCHVTEEFLAFSVAAGNDLVTPIPEYNFPGLQPGDRWCVCVQRWQQALRAKAACPVVLEATHISALEFVTIEELRAHAIA